MRGARRGRYSRGIPATRALRRLSSRHTGAMATTRLKGRRREAARVIGAVAEWATASPDVRAVALVGSYARGTERMASDVDLALLCDNPDAVAGSMWFTGLEPRARLVRSRSWGPVRERRYRLRSGLVVELGFAPLSWAAVPLDPGTRRVLSDGHRVLYDDGTLKPASDASRHGAQSAETSSP